MRRRGVITEIILNILKTILALSLATAAATASAGYRQSDVGPYVSVDAGISSQAGVDVATSEQRAAGLTVGYNFDREFGAELSTYDLGTRQITASRVGTIYWASKVTSVSATVRSELIQNIEFSAKAGLAATSLRATNGSVSGTLSGTGAVIGLGADYRFDRQWSLKANLDMYSDFAGSTDAMSTVTVGVKFRF